MRSMQPLAFAAENPVKTGSMVAWFPSDVDRKALALDREGAEDESAIHVTLAYTGKAAELDDETREGIRASVAKIAASYRPFSVRDQGTGIFQLDPAKNDDNDRCIVALMDAPELETIQEEICHALGDIVRTDHGFTAHATLTYLAPDDELDADLLARSERKMTAGALTVCFGPEQYEYPLGGTEELASKTFDDLRDDMKTKRKKKPSFYETLEALELALLNSEEFYSPNQARDSFGRWTSEGGGPLRDLDSTRPGLQIKGYHTTTEAALESIREHGWDPFAGEGTAFGSGVYSSLDTASGRSGQEKVKHIDSTAGHLQRDGGGLVQIEVEVTTKNPFVMTKDEYDKAYDELEYVDDYEAGLSLAGITPNEYYEATVRYENGAEENLMRFEELHPDVDTTPLYDGGSDDGRAQYVKWHNENTPDEPLQNYYGSYEEQVVRDLMIKKGYDSIIFRDPRIDAPTLGDQIVSFYPEDVKIVRSRPITAAAAVDAELVTFKQLLHILRVS